MFRALLIAVGVTIMIISASAGYIEEMEPAIIVSFVSGFGLFLFGSLLPKRGVGKHVDGEYHVVHKHEYSMIWNLAKIAVIVSAIVGVIKFLGV